MQKCRVSIKYTLMTNFIPIINLILFSIVQLAPILLTCIPQSLHFYNLFMTLPLSLIFTIQVLFQPSAVQELMARLNFSPWKRTKEDLKGVEDTWKFGRVNPSLKTPRQCCDEHYYSYSSSAFSYSRDDYSGCSSCSILWGNLGSSHSLLINKRRVLGVGFHK